MADRLHSIADPTGSITPTTQVVGWSAAWALVVILAGVALASAGVGMTPLIAAALLAGALPGLLAFGLLAGDGRGLRLGLMALWAVAAVTAALLSGGGSSPLAVWCLAPLALAALLARSDMLAAGAACSLFAVIILCATALFGLGAPAPEGVLRPWLTALALVTTTGGLAAALALGRRRNRDTLRRQADRREGLESILAGQPHLTIVTDRLGMVRDHFGAAPVGVPLRVLSHGNVALLAELDDQQSIRDALTQAVQAGQSEVGFHSLSSPEVFLTLTLKSRGDGRLVGVLRDTTEARTALVTAQIGQADAESLAAGRARFLANMSHELRTPLNAIMGFSDIMRNRMFGDLTPKYHEYADLIHDSGTHLLDLINDVLDMSKIEARKFELSREVLDPREPVNAAMRILRLQADDAGVALRASMPSAPLEADVDRRALKQIVLNLVSNALKFTPHGGTVTVALSSQGDNLNLSVSDTGAGISAEDVARLGRPYEQAGDDDRKSKGTGLGLSLVRAFAELHGGEMIIESAVGEGTSVTVRMPVIVPMAEQPTPPVGDNIVAFDPRR